MNTNRMVAHAIEPGIKRDIRQCLKYRRLIRHGSEPRDINRSRILFLLGQLRWCRKQVAEAMTNLRKSQVERRAGR